MNTLPLITYYWHEIQCFGLMYSQLCMHRGGIQLFGEFFQTSLKTSMITGFTQPFKRLLLLNVGNITIAAKHDGEEETL